MTLDDRWLPKQLCKEFLFLVLSWVAVVRLYRIFEEHKSARFRNYPKLAPYLMRAMMMLLDQKEKEKKKVVKSNR